VFLSDYCDSLNKVVGGQNLISNDNRLRLAGLTGVASTLAINPWFAYDPINLPKMLTLTAGASLMLTLLIFNFKSFFFVNKWILAMFLIIFVSMSASLILNNPPFSQQLFGVWGRSTGYLTYVSFMTISLFLAALGSAQTPQRMRMLMERLSYLISFYTLLQWAGLDPINWSQKLMIATLGNINFMSSFLGLASCSFLVRVFLEKGVFTSKSFYFGLILLNLIMIIVSESIQGIAIAGSGLGLVLLVIIRRKLGSLSAIFATGFVSLIGLITFVGSAGIGPLSSFKQETVLFRIDYWKAGLAIVFNNPFLGVGIDSYGDYYRGYRDVVAVERTGPQRVTNTAHNIFLDIASGSGFLAGLAMFLIFAFLFLYVFKAIMRQEASSDLIAWFSILLGFFIFCLISINQIGVGVWGFIAIGILLSHERIERESKIHCVSSQKKKNDKKITHEGSSGTVSKLAGQKSNRFFTYGSLCLVFGISLFLSGLANLTDAKIISAFRSGNLDSALNLSRSLTATDFHREMVITNLSKAGRNSDALDLARKTVEQNPRNWFSWVFIVSSDLSSPSDKQLAGRRLLTLDPNNEAVERDLAEAFKVQLKPGR
jgi:O-antigen ligase